MKRMLYTLAFLAAAMPAARTASAQALFDPEPQLVGDYITDTDAERSRTWWKALSSQLELLVEAPVEEVRPQALQNIIFFASMHGGKVKLNGATDDLVRIYREHPDESVRMMAVTAIHAVGDESGMQAIFSDVYLEQPARLRKTMIAAVNDFYGHRSFLLTAANR